MTVTVPNVPTPVPSRADPANFAVRADAYHTALPGVVDAMNLQNIENNALNASTASLKSQTETIAASVAQTAGVTAWNAVAVYAVGSHVFDPVDFLTYRRKVYGSSGTRPGLDAGNWQLLTGFGDVTLNGVQTLTNKTFVSPVVSGSLFVGTTTAGAANLNGATLVVDTFGSFTDIGHNSTSTNGLPYARFRYDGILIGDITQNGITSVSYNTSSDYRLKNITGPITTSGAYIDNLNPVEGTWKADGSTFVGLIAHEVQEVSRTQVATGEKDGEQMQAMDYSSSELIANMIAEVKSLRARVAALEAK